MFVTCDVLNRYKDEPRFLAPRHIHEYTIRACTTRIRATAVWPVLSVRRTAGIINNIISYFRGCCCGCIILLRRRTRIIRPPGYYLYGRRRARVPLGSDTPTCSSCRRNVYVYSSYRCII